MGGKRVRRRRLSELAPEVDIAAGRVRVDGRVVTNPSSMVLPSSSVVVDEQRDLRGAAKLRAALRGFTVPLAGMVAVDVGAAAGGFTTVLLEKGARRVYALDAGHGQLVGSLRQDPRVVNLEATNLAEVDATLVPDRVDAVTVDVSYLSLHEAVAQLSQRIGFGERAHLVGLVKPMFELHLGHLPRERAQFDEAMARTIAGIEEAGWSVRATMPSPVTGARGAVEFLLWAQLAP